MKIISPPNWKLRQGKIPNENMGDSTSLPNSVSQGCTEVAQRIRGQQTMLILGLLVSIQLIDKNFANFLNQDNTYLF